ncbi:transposon Ty3-I Gag-Pol polyprotein [Trichonephila clavipes]|nr:transposon Ty3-I Gag-Pol polyprotein [Trichonephila clavipes]
MYVDVEQKNWDEILPFVTFAYNTAKQETTGFTPFYLLHGREAETTLDRMLPFCPNDFDDNNITKIAARAEESRQLARVHTLRAQDKDRRRYDSKHQMVSYAPGDLVWVYTPVRKVGLSEKLLRRYFGPYQVLRRLSAVTYEVQDFDPASRKRKLREVVHVLRMKPYHDPAEQIETEDIPPKESYKGPITRSRIKTCCVVTSLSGGRLILPERLGNGLSGTGGLLVSESVSLAEDCDRSGTATSVDGTHCTEDEPTLVPILRNIFRRFCMLNIGVVFSNL